MRTLWVSNHTPFQVDFGGGQRSNLIYRTLREVSEIDVLIISPFDPDGQPAEELFGKGDGRIEAVQALKRGQRLPWKIGRPLAPELVDRVAYNLGRRHVDYAPNPVVMDVVDQMRRETPYDLLIGRHLKNSGQAGLLRSDRAIVDVDDNEIDLYRWILKDPSTRSIRRRVLTSRVRTLEALIPRLLAGGPQLWVTKQEDLSFPGFGRAFVLPNIPFALAREGGPPSPQPYSASTTVLFVGMLGYIFNIEAIDWFLARVWPTVHAQVPEAIFRIVGSRLQERERQRWSSAPGVEVTGFVDDIELAYRDCSFVVAPIWSGGGTNIKTLEALLHGRTCVLTPTAYKGFARTLPDGETVLVAANEEQMAAKCVELLRDVERCREMGLRGATAVAHNYSYDRFREVVLQAVDAVLKTSGGVAPRPTTAY